MCGAVSSAVFSNFKLFPRVFILSQPMSEHCVISLLTHKLLQVCTFLSFYVLIIDHLIIDTF